MQSSSKVLCLSFSPGCEFKSQDHHPAFPLMRQTWDLEVTLFGGCENNSSRLYEVVSPSWRVFFLLSHSSFRQVRSCSHKRSSSSNSRSLTSIWVFFFSIEVNKTQKHSLSCYLETTLQHKHVSRTQYWHWRLLPAKPSVNISAHCERAVTMETGAYYKQVCWNWKIKTIAIHITHLRKRLAANVMKNGSVLDIRTWNAGVEPPLLSSARLSSARLLERICLQ